MDVIYADNAATTQLDIDAFEAMKPFLLAEYGNPSQPYSFSRKAKLALKEARKTIAGCINAEPEEIYFTSGGTESDNWAIKEFGNLGDMKHIVTSCIEHHAILNSCEHMKRCGANVFYVPVNENGIVSLEAIDEFLSEKQEAQTSKTTTLVSIMFANNEIGTIEPVKKISSLVHKYGAVFHTDAVQAVGHVNVDVKEMGIDMLSASAHKFNGPKGIGFIYIKKGLNIQSHHDGGSQESGKRAGTENVSAIVAMATALKKNVESLDKNTVHILELENVILSGLNDKGIIYRRNGDVKCIPGNISLSFPGYEGETLLHRLDLMKICVSTGSACDSQRTQISHVLKAINLSDEYARGTIRISLGINNTYNDAKEIVNALVKILH